MEQEVQVYKSESTIIQRRKCHFIVYHKTTSTILKNRGYHYTKEKNKFYNYDLIPNLSKPQSIKKYKNIEPQQNYLVFIKKNVLGNHIRDKDRGLAARYLDFKKLIHLILQNTDTDMTSMWKISNEVGCNRESAETRR